MTATVKACEACREILREGGYTVEVVRGHETLDACEICGLRTGVMFCEIRKGTDSHASDTVTGSE